MAQRFWVGGAGTWDGSSTAHWAATSGGASGASAPTTADDVFLNASAGAGTITVAAGAACHDLDCTGFTQTLSLPNTAQILTVAGSLKFVAGMTLTVAGNTTSISYTGTVTGLQITTGTKQMPGAVFDGVGGEWKLQDNYTTGAGTQVFTVTNGTFDTNNKALTCGSLVSSNTNVRTIKLGSSAVQLQNNNGSIISFATQTNLTFDAGTSTITFTSNNVTATVGVGVTFYNMVFQGNGANAISGANTFNNLTVTGAAVKNETFTLQGNQVVNGTFTITSNSITNRVLLTSNLGGVARTVTAAAFSFSQVDFQDITAVGTTWTGTNLGDAGGNTNITFAGANTRYAVAAGNWSTTATWSATSGGASGASVPLPQDTVFIDASSGVGTITADMPRMGKDLDCTGYTGTLAFSLVVNMVCGNLALATGMTVSGTFTLTLAGRAACTLTSATKAFTQTVNIAGAYTMQDSFSGTALNLNSGTLTVGANNIALTTSFGSNTSSTRVLNMGSGTWTLSGTGTVLTLGGISTLTVNSQTSTVAVTDASSTDKNLSIASTITLNAVTITAGGSGRVTFLGGFSTMTVTTLTIGAPKTVRVQAGGTVAIGTLNASGSGANLVSFISNLPGTTYSLQFASRQSIDRVSITDMVVTTGPGDYAPLYAGVNSSNGGNNTRVVFATPSYRWAGHHFFP